MNPSEPNGAVDGQQPRATRNDRPAEAVHTQDDGPGPATGQSGGPGQPSAGPEASSQPEAGLASLCRRCGTVVTSANQKCPKCGCFLRHNKLAEKEPVNQHAVRAISRRLHAEYAPTSTVDVATVEQLASVLERIDAAKPGSPEWQRMIAGSQALAERLAAVRPSSAPADYAAMDDAERIDRLSSVLKDLLIAQDASRQAAALAIAAATGLATTASGTGSESDASAPVIASPRPICQYCGMPCVGEGHPAFQVLHWNAPDQVAERDARATAVALRMLPYGHRHVR